MQLLRDKHAQEKYLSIKTTNLQIWQFCLIQKLNLDLLQNNFIFINKLIDFNLLSNTFVMYSDKFNKTQIKMHSLNNLLKIKLFINLI